MRIHVLRNLRAPLWLTSIALVTTGTHDTTSQNFAIGATDQALGEYFNGTLDNVAIFNQALTAQQVATIVSDDFSQFTVPEPGSLWMGLAAAGLLALSRTRHRAARRS